MAEPSYSDYERGFSDEIEYGRVDPDVVKAAWSAYKKSQRNGARDAFTLLASAVFPQFFGAPLPGLTPSPRTETAFELFTNKALSRRKRVFAKKGVCDPLHEPCGYDADTMQYRADTLHEPRTNRATTEQEESQVGTQNDPLNDGINDGIVSQQSINSQLLTTTINSQPLTTAKEKGGEEDKKYPPLPSNKKKGCLNNTPSPVYLTLERLIAEAEKELTGREEYVLTSSIALEQWATKLAENGFKDKHGCDVFERITDSESGEEVERWRLMIRGLSRKAERDMDIACGILPQTDEWQPTRDSNLEEIATPTLLDLPEKVGTYRGCNVYLIGTMKAISAGGAWYRLRD